MIILKLFKNLCFAIILYAAIQVVLIFMFFCMIVEGRDFFAECVDANDCADRKLKIVPEEK